MKLIEETLYGEPVSHNMLYKSCIYNYCTSNPSNHLVV